MTIKELVQMIVNNMPMATPIVVVSKNDLAIREALFIELNYVKVASGIRTEVISTDYGYTIAVIYGLKGVTMVLFTAPYRNRLPDFFKTRSHIVSNVEITNRDAELAAYEARDAQDPSAYEDVNMGSGVSSTDEVSDADKGD